MLNEYRRLSRTFDSTGFCLESKRSSMFRLENGMQEKNRTFLLPLLTFWKDRNWGGERALDALFAHNEAKHTIHVHRCRPRLPLHARLQHCKSIEHGSSFGKQVLVVVDEVPPSVVVVVVVVVVVGDEDVVDAVVVVAVVAAVVAAVVVEDVVDVVAAVVVVEDVVDVVSAVVVVVVGVENVADVVAAVVWVGEVVVDVVVVVVAAAVVVVPPSGAKALFGTLGPRF